MFEVLLGLEFKVDLWFRLRFRVYGCGSMFQDYTQIQLDLGLRCAYKSLH